MPSESGASYHSGPPNPPANSPINPFTRTLDMAALNDTLVRSTALEGMRLGEPSFVPHNSPVNSNEAGSESGGGGAVVDMPSIDAALQGKKPSSFPALNVTHTRLW